MFRVNILPLESDMRKQTCRVRGGSMYLSLEYDLSKRICKEGGQGTMEDHLLPRALIGLFVIFITGI